MIVVPFVVLAGTPEAVSITNKLEAAHQRLSRGAVFVWDGMSTAIPTKVSFSTASCRLQMPNQQIVEVRPSEIRFYDELFNQVASLKNAKPIKVPDSGAKVAIVQREPIAWLLDSQQRTDFFKEMKIDKRWKVRGSSLVLSDSKSKYLSEVHFDNAYRVVRIRLSLGAKPVSDWRYRYVSESDIPSIPSNAKVVRGLPPRPTMPGKTDGKTVLFAQKIWRAMSRLEGKKLTQISDDGTYTLTYGSGKVSESGPNGAWSMVGKKLTVTPKSGSAKTFEGSSDQSLDKLRSEGIYVSPIARYIINRQIPFLDMFDRTDEVKLLNGTMNLDGKNLSMLSLKRSGIHIRMYVDPITGQIAKVSSDATDPSGNLISGSQLKVKYQ